MAPAKNAEPKDYALPPDIALSLEEYRTVREEELVALQGQITTLRYGVAGCVVLIGFAAQQHGDRYLGWAVSLALVPLVVLFSAIIWMGEYERVARAGHYITDLESRINARLRACADRPLRWESWLREGGNSPSRLVGGHHRYLAIACVFIGFQIASVVMGLHFYWHGHSHDSSRHWLIPVAVVVNIAILLTLLGYFRSSYERLRDYTIEPEQRHPIVRQRVRMRFRLYSLFGLVGFLSAPFCVWPLGLVFVWGVRSLDVVGSFPIFWAALPTFIWMSVIPLAASRELMRELLSTRILPEHHIEKGEEQALAEQGLLSQLTSWERRLLRFVYSAAPNGPSIGRNRHIVVTKAALEGDDLPGPLAHEIGHHRLHHLHPLALSYLYLWPYMYFDRRFSRAPGRPGWRKRCRPLIRVVFSVAAVPGWGAWTLLRLGWRTAEYDADRFACASGHGNELADALRRAEKERKDAQPRGWGEYREKWRERLAQGRGLGYLPVPNEHPIPRRRLRRVEEWLRVDEALHAGRLGGPTAPSEGPAGI